MRTHNRTHSSKLHPACVHLGVNTVNTAPMSADIMTPVAIEHIRSSAIEIRLEIERIPRNHGIAREANLIAMVAESAPAVINHGALIGVILHIREEASAHPPCIFQLSHFFIVDALLPVEPPKVDAVVHHRVKNHIEHSSHEFLVAREPIYALFRGRVHAHNACHFRIFLFIPIHAACRMHIQRNFQVIFLQVLEQSAIVGEKLFVPCPAGPASTITFHIVPVHINHEHIERETIVVQVFHQIAQFFIGIEPKSRPPIAEGVTRRKRHFPCKDGVIFQSALIVGAVGHKIPVLTLRILALSHPLPFLVAVEKQALRVINESPTVACYHAVLDFHVLTFFPFSRIRCAYIAIVGVESTERSFEICGLLHSRFPSELKRAFLL